MKALVYGGPGLKAIEDRPTPEIQAPGDAIVKMVKTTICGTDLHILKGDVATCAAGRILGHEGVGLVDSVGAGVTAFHPGDGATTVSPKFRFGADGLSSTPTHVRVLRCGYRRC